MNDMSNLVQRLRELADGYEELTELDEAADEIEKLGQLLCELMECEAAGPFSDAMPPALLEKWQAACDRSIDAMADPLTAKETP